MDTDHPTGPLARGSEQALAALRALNEWNCPALRSEICALARVTDTEAMLALRGLRERGLVTCDTRGPAARWSLTRWAREAAKAAA